MPDEPTQEWNPTPFLEIHDGPHIYVKARWHSRTDWLCQISLTANGATQHWVKDLKDFHWKTGMVISIAYDFLTTEGSVQYSVERMTKLLETCGWEKTE